MGRPGHNCNPDYLLPRAAPARCVAAGHDDSAPTAAEMRMPWSQAASRCKTGARGGQGFLSGTNVAWGHPDNPGIAGRKTAAPVLPVRAASVCLKTRHRCSSRSRRFSVAPAPAPSTPLAMLGAHEHSNRRADIDRTSHGLSVRILIG
jgi:hypothetical protein